MLRPIYAVALSFIIGVLIGSPVIRTLGGLRADQKIRSDGPKGHLSKTGTPTMGGIIILISLLVSVFVFINDFQYIAWALFVTLGFGVIGFCDDLLIILKGRSLGLKARHKIGGELLIVGLFALFAWTEPGLGQEILIPITENWIGLGFLYPVFVVIVIVGSSNAVNLTDGLDGLAAGTAAISAGVLGIIAYSIGEMELAIFAGGITGACLGFLLFNAHPAKVFMGDTGSLALGAGLGVLAVLLKRELFFLIIGGVFVIETVSVMIQVVSFQIFGKRVFKMSPLHHHFELIGWSEPKVVTMFLFMALIFGIIGLIAEGIF